MKVTIEIAEDTSLYWYMRYFYAKHGGFNTFQEFAEDYLLECAITDKQLDEIAEASEEIIAMFPEAAPYFE